MLWIVEYSGWIEEYVRYIQVCCGIFSCVAQYPFMLWNIHEKL